MYISAMISAIKNKKILLCVSFASLSIIQSDTTFVIRCTDSDTEQLQNMYQSRFCDQLRQVATSKQFTDILRDAIPALLREEQGFQEDVEAFVTNEHMSDQVMNRYFLTAIDIAIQDEQYDFLKCVFCRMIKFDSKEESYVTYADCIGRNILMHAAYHGFTDMVESLIKNETTRELVGQTNKYGRTALMYAAQNGKTEVVKILASYEAEIPDKDGQTALMMAAQNGYTDDCGYLLEEAGMCNRYGYTALIYAYMLQRIRTQECYKLY